MNPIAEALSKMEQYSSRKYESSNKGTVFQRCPYCKDKTFLNIRADYMLANKIPVDCQLFDGPTAETLAIQCICNKNNAQAFENRFGVPLDTSNLGRAIRGERRTEQTEVEEWPF
jgi:hypothetical protein